MPPPPPPVIGGKQPPTIVITARPDGQLQVQTNVGNTALALGMMELGKTVIIAQGGKPAEPEIALGNNILGGALKRN